MSTNKKVPIIDFLQSLNQPHIEKIDFTLLPRFGCRAYKLIDPKPGKFEPRAEQGWFLGFQINTNKNYLIYHPHLTPKQGYKWVESFTPHVTFNEDVMFGDMLSPVNRQKTDSYWTNKIDLSEDRPPFYSSAPLQNLQTPKFGGETIPTTSAQKPVSIQPNVLTHQSGIESLPTIPTIPPLIKPPLVNNNLEILAPQDVPVVPKDVWPNDSIDKGNKTSSSCLDTEQQILKDSQTLILSSAGSDYDSFSEEENELEEIDE